MNLKATDYIVVGAISALNLFTVLCTHLVAGLNLHVLTKHVIQVYNKNIEYGLTRFWRDVSTFNGSSLRTKPLRMWFSSEHQLMFIGAVYFFVLPGTAGTALNTNSIDRNITIIKLPKKCF